MPENSSTLVYKQKSYKIFFLFGALLLITILAIGSFFVYKNITTQGTPPNNGVTLYPYDPDSPMVTHLGLIYTITGEVIRSESLPEGKHRLVLSNPEHRVNFQLDIEVHPDLVVTNNRSEKIELTDIKPVRKATINLFFDRLTGKQIVNTINVIQ